MAGQGWGGILGIALTVKRVINGGKSSMNDVILYSGAGGVCSTGQGIHYSLLPGRDSRCAWATCLLLT